MSIDAACEELEAALGPENVSREPAVLEGYAWQAFDPDDVSDAGFYISLDPVGTIREAIARSPEMAAFLAARLKELGMDDEGRKE
ncbi:MAG: hypothetical protein QME88_03470 [Actinomycetota bacterium]|nr:hypothetical protein [Actinomycetota bacterium]